METRTCTKCNTTYPVEGYYKNGHYRSRVCKVCKGEGVRRRHLERKFGITEEQFVEMSKAQGDVCKICGKPEGEENRRTRLTIDHCHSTGKIRGLLCHNCNTAIGLMKDNISNFENAILYIKEHA